MFPFLLCNANHETLVPTRAQEPSRRIDVQRHSLEHKKMYHLNTMAVEQSFADLDRQLASRRQIELATDGRDTPITQIRRFMAAVLISTGQRIRPDAPLAEPRFNG